MKYLFLLGCSFVAAAPAMAQSADEVDGNDIPCITGTRIVRDHEITVTASGSRLEIDQSGQPVSVIADTE
ncbi:MAG: hypothetical protein ACKOPQ_01325, partial [Novosphingobium sp.]